MTKDNLTQTQIESLRREFGSSKVADYFEVAEYLKVNNESVTGIVASIDKGTADKVEAIKQQEKLKKQSNGHK